MFQVLCRVKQVSLLKELILGCKEEANELASELIFKNNPALQDDPHNAFFQQLVDCLGASLIHKIAGYVFKHESVERKLILAANCPLPLIASNIEHIPAQVITDLNSQRFLGSSCGGERKT